MSCCHIDIYILVGIQIKSYSLKLFTHYCNLKHLLNYQMSYVCHSHPPEQEQSRVHFKAAPTHLHLGVHPFLHHCMHGISIYDNIVRLLGAWSIVDAILQYPSPFCWTRKFWNLSYCHAPAIRLVARPLNVLLGLVVCSPSLLTSV